MGVSVSVSGSVIMVVCENMRVSVSVHVGVKSECVSVNACAVWV